MRRKSVVRFLEFAVIGIVFGIIEDIIAIKLSTGVTITLNTVWIAFLVAFPFAAFSELVVDHPKFKEKLFKRFGHRKR